MKKKIKVAIQRCAYESESSTKPFILDEYKDISDYINEDCSIDYKTEITSLNDAIPKLYRIQQEKSIHPLDFEPFAEKVLLKLLKK